MQFKHPEILWALLLLLIPIFIHLFQLRRFKKEPFTNVAMLQKVISESRKSSTLKKWLLLLTRLGLIAALVIAFAQPFSSSEKALKPMETVIYLDNSFSMQAKSDGVPLMEKAVQELIQNMESETVFSLFTNNRVFKNVTLKDVQNQLLSIGYTQNQYEFGDLFLKAETLFSQNEAQTKKLLLLSDFQDVATDSVPGGTIESHYVQFRPDNEVNVAIDSVYLNGNTTGPGTLSVLLSGAMDQSVPISLYDGDKLIAKTSANFGDRGVAKVEFSLSGRTQIDGRLEINDAGLAYDNSFYFNLNKTEAINVLAITEADADYLAKLFPNDEFAFERTSLSQLNYSSIDSQNMVILDNLASIPESLRRTLKSFYDNSGSLVVIPAEQIDLQSYNTMLQSFGGHALNDPIRIEQMISGIAFAHPLYKDVFEKNVSNFQYPKVNTYYPISSNTTKILSYASNEPFLLGGNGFYLFTAPLTANNSNFKNSPLIVPTFYNMAQFSLKSPDLFFMLGEPSQTDVAISLGKDNVLSLSKNGNQIIPRQQSFNKKVSLFFDDNPQEDGIFSIQSQDSVYKKASFNYRRDESKLRYADMDNLGGIDGKNSITSLFDQIKSENAIVAYWKWFVILALLFALVEALIQKFIT